MQRNAHQGWNPHPGDRRTAGYDGRPGDEPFPRSAGFVQNHPSHAQHMYRGGDHGNFGSEVLAPPYSAPPATVPGPNGVEAGAFQAPRNLAEPLLDSRVEEAKDSFQSALSPFVPGKFSPTVPPGGIPDRAREPLLWARWRKQEEIRFKQFKRDEATREEHHKRAVQKEYREWQLEQRRNRRLREKAARRSQQRAVEKTDSDPKAISRDRKPVLPPPKFAGGRQIEIEGADISLRKDAEMTPVQVNSVGDEAKRRTSEKRPSSGVLEEEETSHAVSVQLSVKPTRKRAKPETVKNVDDRDTPRAVSEPSVKRARTQSKPETPKHSDGSLPTAGSRRTKVAAIPVAEVTTSKTRATTKKPARAKSNAKSKPSKKKSKSKKKKAKVEKGSSSDLSSSSGADDFLVAPPSPPYRRKSLQKKQPKAAPKRDTTRRRGRGDEDDVDWSALSQVSNHGGRRTATWRSLFAGLQTEEEQMAAALAESNRMAENDDTERKLADQFAKEQRAREVCERGAAHWKRVLGAQLLRERERGFKDFDSSVHFVDERLKQHMTHLVFNRQRFYHAAVAFAAGAIAPDENPGASKSNGSLP